MQSDPNKQKTILFSRERTAGKKKKVAGWECKQLDV